VVFWVPSSDFPAAGLPESVLYLALSHSILCAAFVLPSTYLITIECWAVFPLGRVPPPACLQRLPQPRRPARSRHLNAVVMRSFSHARLNAVQSQLLVSTLLEWAERVLCGAAPQRLCQKLLRKHPSVPWYMLFLTHGMVPWPFSPHFLPFLYQAAWFFPGGDHVANPELIALGRTLLAARAPPCATESASSVATAATSAAPALYPSDSPLPSAPTLLPPVSAAPASARPEDSASVHFAADGAGPLPDGLPLGLGPATLAYLVSATGHASSSAGDGGDDMVRETGALAPHGEKRMRAECDDAIAAKPKAAKGSDARISLRFAEVRDKGS